MVVQQIFFSFMANIVACEKFLHVSFISKPMTTHT